MNGLHCQRLSLASSGIVFRWLEHGIDGDWLMILDNVDDLAVFSHAAASVFRTNHHTGYAAALSAYLAKKNPKGQF
jgi:hypothetical protein